MGQSCDHFDYCYSEYWVTVSDMALHQVSVDFPSHLLAVVAQCQTHHSAALGDC